MGNKVFTTEEQNLIKSMIRKQSREKGNDIDEDKALQRFVYVLSNTKPNITTRFLNNVEYSCATAKPPKDKYSQLAYFALRMDEWVKLNFIIDVTKHGTMIFIPKHPDKENKYLFTSKSDRVWTRDDFSNVIEDGAEDDGQERE